MSDIRIVAGEFRGRRIAVPETGTRPLADRMRQSLFAVLEPRLLGARVIDLCAGSGAAGIEALSRGAAHATLVERAPRAAAVIRSNITQLGLDERATVVSADALRTLETLGARGELFDLIILDPPYDDDLLRAALLERLAGPDSVVAPRGLVVAPGRRGGGTDGQEGAGALRLVRELIFGESVIELRERRVEES
jgi:16S rRNA (guanine966-N2)-methyltransferase